MPVLSYLADTNALSDIMRGQEDVRTWFTARPGEVAISTLTLAELRAGIELKTEGKRRRELERDFQFVLEDYSGAILVFDEAAAFEWGRLMSEARNHPLAYDDSLIAAIARSLGLRVVTRNIKDFPGCSTVDPWTGIEYPGWSQGGVVEIRPMRDGKNSILLTPRPGKRRGAVGLLKQFSNCPTIIRLPERHNLPFK